MALSNAVENGKKALETLRSFLADMNLEPEEEAFPEGTAFRFKMEGPTPKAIARILVEKERFTVHFYFDRSVPQESLIKVAEFITRVNYGLVIGNLEMSFRDGTVRFKASVDFTSTELTEPLIRNAMLSSMDSIEVLAMPLWSLLDGELEPGAAYERVRAEQPE